MYESGKGSNRKLVSSTRQKASDAFEKHLPSPLAGEGQGEGIKSVSVANTSTQNSSLKTQNA
jgi:hypothetical protein